MRCGLSSVGQQRHLYFMYGESHSSLQEWQISFSGVIRGCCIHEVRVFMEHSCEPSLNMPIFNMALTSTPLLRSDASFGFPSSLSRSKLCQFALVLPPVIFFTFLCRLCQYCLALYCCCYVVNKGLVTDRMN